MGAILLMMVFSCQDNYKEIQKINQFNYIPVGIAETMRLVYTDSSKTKAVLTAPINKDFTNQKFPFSEFPDGLKVVFYDQDMNATEVTSDYGILYNKTQIIDLQGHVVIQTHDGAVLKTSQLYWDPDQEWLFTEKNFTFTSDDYDINAVRLDASRNFTVFRTGALKGTIAVEEENTP
ncbi:MAG: LPS export ABC transporter periplasmic protein LptC [Flavobacteriaceae bacterium]|nr:LPS export ABC transporter periplasmic protein LptC [Flavobacteriaceae bacterium]